MPQAGFYTMSTVHTYSAKSLAAVYPLPLVLYRTATHAAALPLRIYLDRRLRRGKEDAARFGERLGRAGQPRPVGPLLWLHGASVGESLSALPLIDALRHHRPELQILVTSGTVTSAAILGERLPVGVVHQYVPVDRPLWVRRFLDHWRPDLVLWLESELWPNMLAEIRARQVPAVLLNARMSETSCRRWIRWAPGTIRWLLATFARCLAQSEADGGRYRRLGAGDVACLGNLKAAAAALPADERALAALRAEIGTRPLWLAASTHAGEEAAVAAVHRRLARPGLLTVIVPRHAGRGPEIAAELRSAGLRVARRAAGEAPTAGCDIYVADTMGELGLFYRLAPIAFVGKSLVGRGGQNPLEAARLGCAVLYGPHMGNFAETAAALVDAGAAVTVADEAALARAVGTLLDDPEARRHQGSAARAFAEAEAGTLQRVLAAIAPLLP